MTHQSHDAAPLAEAMRRFVTEVQAGGDVGLIDTLVREDFVNRTPMPGQPAGREGVRVAVQALHAAFTDFTVELVHCVAAGDVVSTHKIFRGTHTGDWAGVAASGRPVEFAVMDVTRFRDDRWAEHWSVADGLTVLAQIGAPAT